MIQVWIGVLEAYFGVLFTIFVASVFFVTELLSSAGLELGLHCLLHLQCLQTCQRPDLADGCLSNPVPVIKLLLALSAAGIMTLTCD